MPDEDEKDEKTKPKQVFLTYALLHEDGRRVQWFCRAVSWKKIDKDAMERESDRVRERFNNAYGEGWYVQKYWGHEPVKDTYVATIRESQELKEQAFDEILDGPDCRVRRWLEWYLNEGKTKRPPTNPRKVPVRIREAVMDDIPF